LILSPHAKGSTARHGGPSFAQSWALKVFHGRVAREGDWPSGRRGGNSVGLAGRHEYKSNVGQLFPLRAIGITDPHFSRHRSQNDSRKNASMLLFSATENVHVPGIKKERQLGGARVCLSVMEIASNSAIPSFESSSLLPYWESQVLLLGLHKNSDIKRSRLSSRAARSYTTDYRPVSVIAVSHTLFRRTRQRNAAPYVIHGGFKAKGEALCPRCNELAR
jgi:hypothetical protein